MNRELWNEWLNEYTFDLLRQIRSLRFGEMTIKIHEKQPVEIREAWQSKRLGKKQGPKGETMVGENING